MKIEVSQEVPGTPEQVWEAIATGPGISAWFVETSVDGQVGGKVAFDMGGGMEETGVVSVWDPPHRFAAEEAWEGGSVGTEYLVEARDGGTCVVRIVSTMPDAGDDWEAELGSMREGWEMFLHNLRLYLERFAGQPHALLTLGGGATGPIDDAWASLRQRLGLPDAAVGERAAVSAPGVPALAGTVDWRPTGDVHRGLLLVLDEPGPGTALVFVNEWQGQVMANLQIRLFGDGAAAALAEDEPAWRAWMTEAFPGPPPC